MERTLDDMLDARIGPVGSAQRAAFDASVASMRRRDERLDRIFGWMKHIPPRFPSKKEAGDWDENYWKGLGRLMFLFWRTTADEGWAGALDMLAFHYFDDAYVLMPHGRGLPPALRVHLGARVPARRCRGQGAADREREHRLLREAHDPPRPR